MKPFAVLDMHCDTLTNCECVPRQDDTLNTNTSNISLSSVPVGVNWAQFYAVFVPDEYTACGADAFFDATYKNFTRQMDKFKSRVLWCSSSEDICSAWNNNKHAAVLTVENGNVLCGREESILHLASCNVKALTLVWNGKNELGSGVGASGGLTDFGKAVIPLLEENKIAVDVSHLNDKGLEDVLKIATKPFLATHSNARSVCNHKRNLPDEFIKELSTRGCVIGLNYHSAFLCEDGVVSGYDDLYRHISHFLELGAQDSLALGSDFDGADIPPCINTPAKVMSFYDYLVNHDVTKSQADALFYKNARRIIEELF